MLINYLHSFFNKPVEQLVLSDIEHFFSSEQEETSTIEFKTGEVDIIGLYKEVAAFLNTEGGLIIVGSPKEQKIIIGKTEKRICKGDITYSNFNSKDWLFQKLYANITPPPMGVVIKEFLTEKGNVFLIGVPQSSTPPHQCNADGRYYIRIESEAKPAPHGLVQALFDKRKKAALDVAITGKQINQFENALSVVIFNQADYPADKVSFLIDIYNIESVDSKDSYSEIYDTDLGKKFAYSKSTTQLLPRFLEMPNHLKVKHKSSPYVIFVAYYAKDLDFNGKYFLIDPISASVKSQYECFNSEKSLKELLLEISAL